MKITKYNESIMIVSLLLFFPLTLHAGVFTKEAELSSDLLTIETPISYMVDFGVTFNQIDTVTYSFTFGDDQLDPGECLSIDNFGGFCNNNDTPIAYKQLSSPYPENTDRFKDGTESGQLTTEPCYFCPITNPSPSIRITSLEITISGVRPIYANCDGLNGAANGLCHAYCEAQDCDLQPDKNSCKKLKKNYAKITGEDKFPCEVPIVPIACCFCADIPEINGGVCEEISENECLSRGGLPIEANSCNGVACPLESVEPGCILAESWPYIPRCQNIPSWICEGPAEGELLDEPCPGVPPCE